MATEASTNHTNPDNAAVNGQNGVGHQDFEKATQHMSHQEKNTAMHAARFGYGPLAHMRTNNNESTLPGEHTLIYGQSNFNLTGISFRW